MKKKEENELKTSESLMRNGNILHAKECGHKPPISGMIEGCVKKMSLAQDVLNKSHFKKTALISVSDRKGLVAFTKGLKKLGFSFVASGRNADYLEKHGIRALKTSRLTGWPPIMNPQGVKTIHPRIYGGIFVNPNKKDHLTDVRRYGIIPFNIVVCNFYPFERTITRRGFNHKDAIRNLDIGGPAMVRAAAKHYAYRTVLVDPADYTKVLKELREKEEVDMATRRLLSIKAFERCIGYDNSIVKYLKRVGYGM
jgi:phosphoribosylaminoimidazolecarboxamide formyltransferase/IMP cyclohydrolase